MRQQQGKTPPSEADWKWVAELFATRGGFMRYSSSFAARVHSTNRELMQRLLDTFGGSVSQVAGTLQWRISGELLRSFLQSLRPFLEELKPRFGSELLDLVDDALAKIPPPMRRRGALVLAAINADNGASAAAASTLLSPGEEPFGRVPSGPWDADQVLFQLARDEQVFPTGMLLEAESAEQAAQFAAAARQHTQLAVEHSGALVRLKAS